MTKAEERAMEIYPSGMLFVTSERGAFINGYEQAKKDIFHAVLAILEKDYGFDTLDRVEFIMKYERMTGESIPDDWLEKGVMKTVKL